MSARRKKTAAVASLVRAIHETEKRIAQQPDNHALPLWLGKLRGQLAQLTTRRHAPEEMRNGKR